MLLLVNSCVFNVIILQYMDTVAGILVSSTKKDRPYERKLVSALSTDDGQIPENVDARK
jgi:hypothetical protein